MPKKSPIDESQIAYQKSIDYDKTLLSPKEIAAAINVHVTYIYCACGYKPNPFRFTAGVATVNEFRGWLRRNPQYRMRDGYLSIEKVIEKRGPIQNELFSE
jgi:hypothetical protein